MSSTPAHVPPAPVEHDEYVVSPEEVQHNTLWHNPTEKDVRLPLHIGVTPIYGDPAKRRPLTREERTGIRTFIVPAKSTVAIPKEFDKAIHDVRNDMIVGGLGPYLEKKGVQVKPTLAPALNAALAEAQAKGAVAAQLALDKVALEQQLAMKNAEAAAAMAKLAEYEAMVAAATSPKAEPPTGQPAEQTNPQQKRKG